MYLYTPLLVPIVIIFICTIVGHHRRPYDPAVGRERYAVLQLLGVAGRVPDAGGGQGHSRDLLLPHPPMRGGVADLSSRDCKADEGRAKGREAGGRLG